MKRIVRMLLPEPIWNGLRKFRQKIQLFIYRRRQVRHRYGRWELDVIIADDAARRWYDRDWDALPEMEVLAEHRLKAGARVFNVGAHQSVVGLMLAGAVGPEGEVIAIEAHPHNYRISLENKALNGAENLIVVHSAVAEKPGEIHFGIDLNGAIDSGRVGGTIPVPAITIDSLTDKFGPPDVIFMDIEGYEETALLGAQKTMEHYPDFFIEVHVGCGLESFKGSVAGLLSKFDPSRYSFRIASERQKEFSPLALDSPLLKDRFYLLALSR